MCTKYIITHICICVSACIRYHAIAYQNTNAYNIDIHVYRFASAHMFTYRPAS